MVSPYQNVSRRAWENRYPRDHKAFTTRTMAAPYLLSLCDLAKTSEFSFGMVSRLHTQTSTFKVEASKLIHGIVTFSPASESMAIQFLHEFEKISYLKDLGILPLATPQFQD